MCVIRAAQCLGGCQHFEQQRTPVQRSCDGSTFTLQALSCLLERCSYGGLAVVWVCHASVILLSFLVVFLVVPLLPV